IFTAAGFTSFAALEVTSYLQNNNSNIFLYEFDYVSTIGRIYKVPGWDPVPHTAELPFIWMQKPIWQKAIDSLEVVPDDYIMADFFGSAWANFAKTGFKCDENRNCPPWLPTILEGNNLRYLAINAHKNMMPNYRPVDRSTFNRVLPTLQQQWIAAAQQQSSSTY
uniref:COesterase domain-containing protein n=1 Tax=Ascaris lumbricoides TaxID=6252 RepID=A0A0M3IBX3_ASCLU